MNAKELKPGDIFKFEDKTWICTKNDGFILSADNMDKEDITANFMWIGCIDKNEVEVIE